MIKYKSFKISELFIKKTIKGVPKKEENLTFNPSGYHMFGQNIKYQYQQKILLDEKYLQKVDPKYPILAYTSSVGEIGIISEDFYRSGDNGAFQGLFSKEYKFNYRELLYILTVLKNIFRYFGYETSMANIMDIKIKLPVDESGKINYVYMNNFIKKLEKESLNKFSNYLKERGFEKHELTIDEKKFLELYRQGGINFSKFKIGELFDIHPTKSYGLTNSKLYSLNGKTPVVVNSSVNNGIGGYTDLAPTEKGNKITFSDTTTDNAIFYQPNDFVGYPHVQGLYPRNNVVWSEKALLYFLTLFKKCAKGRFDYATKFNRSIAAQMEVSLPVKDSCIDFFVMEYFINIKQKLIINKVVDWQIKEVLMLNN